MVLTPLGLVQNELLNFPSSLKTFQFSFVFFTLCYIILFESSLRMKRSILITIDTLRADHLGCYGYLRKTSPAIDRLAEKSLFYEKAFSPVSYTTPSIVSMFTSRYPSFHHMGFMQGTKRLPSKREITLQEILHNKGVRTAAFVSTIMLNKRHTGLNRGFDIYDDVVSESELNRKDVLFRRAEGTMSKALRWLDSHHKESFFLWIHFMDVHGPYNPPPPYNCLFINHHSSDDPYWNKEPILLDRIIDTPGLFSRAPINFQPGIFSYQVLDKKVDKQGSVIGFQKDVRHYISQYDGAIRYVDDQIKRLFACLEQKNIFDETAIIMTSDHGEAFGENDVFFFHGLTVSLDQIKIPLIIKLPGSESNKISEPVSLPVSLIDIMPTLLDLYGVNTKSTDIQGISLVSSDVKKERAVMSQIVSQLSTILGDYQFLYCEGWFENKYGNIFGIDIDRIHLQLNGTSRMFNIKTGKEIDPNGHDGLGKYQEHSRAFIQKTFEEGKTHDRSKLFNMAKKIKDKLAALGYVDF